MPIKRLEEDVLILSGVRLGYPHLFTASAPTAGAKKKFSADLVLVEDEDIEDLGNAVEALIKSELKGKRPPDNSIALRRYEDGMYFLKAANTSQPLLLAADMGKVTDEDSSPFYPGCFVNAKVALRVNTEQGKRAVYAVLYAVQFAKHGAPFGSVMSEEDAADGFSASEEADDIF